MNDESENTNKTAEEEWAMGDLTFYSKQKIEIKDGDGTAPEKNAEDWTMNAPIISTLEEKKQDAWKMPEPVFRVSSGKTPEKFKKTEDKTESSANEPATSEKPAAAIGVQPQPYISEDFIVGDIVETAPAKTEKTSSKTIYVVIGLIAMIVFAIVFVIGIYFLFFYKTDV